MIFKQKRDDSESCS